ncbi:MAG: AAA family ATPase [Candidatus Diapherotrites archaeon]|nr:AAA family ATPase [Candidatus Diapherotrites archaeon]
MMVIGLTGRARTGKDTVAEHIAEKYGFAKFTFSDMLAESLKKMGRPVTKEEMYKLSDEWIKEFGKDVMPKKLFELIGEKEKVVISGFRSLNDIQFAKKKAERFILIFLDAPAEARAERDANLLGIDFETSLKRVKDRDKHDNKSYGLEKVIKKADAVVDSSCPIPEMFAKVDKIVDEFMK